MPQPGQEMQSLARCNGVHLILRIPAEP